MVIGLMKQQVEQQQRGGGYIGHSEIEIIIKSSREMTGQAQKINATVIG